MFSYCRNDLTCLASLIASTPRQVEIKIQIHLLFLSLLFFNLRESHGCSTEREKSTCPKKCDKVYIENGCGPAFRKKSCLFELFCFFPMRNGQLEALFAGKTGMEFGRIMSWISKRLTDAQQHGARKPEIAARRIERGFIFGLEEK